MPSECADSYATCSTAEESALVVVVDPPSAAGFVMVLADVGLQRLS